MWATGDEVLNVNEAHAYASCSNCVTVAVAFQVVLIMDDAQVVVPQNLSVAANYHCYRCITAAIASQLVLSVDEAAGEGQLLALGEVWDRLTEFGRTITAYSLSEITTRLEGFKTEIVAILGDAPPVETDSTPGPGPTGTPSDGSSASSTGSPSTDAGSSPGTSPSGSTSTSPDSSVHIVGQQRAEPEPAGALRTVGGADRGDRDSHAVAGADRFHPDALTVHVAVHIAVGKAAAGGDSVAAGSGRPRRCCSLVVELSRCGYGAAARRARARRRPVHRPPARCP